MAKRKPVLVEGVLHYSITDAALEMSSSATTVKNRCNGVIASKPHCRWTRRLDGWRIEQNYPAGSYEIHTPAGVFSSWSEAAERHGVTTTTIRYRTRRWIGWDVHPVRKRAGK